MLLRPGNEFKEYGDSVGIWYCVTAIESKISSLLRRRSLGGEISGFVIIPLIPHVLNYSFFLVQV